MTFAYPWVLLFLALPVILIWTAIARPWGIVLPFDHQRHDRRRWLTGLLGFFDVVPLLLMAAAIIILADPQMMKPPRRERTLTNIQFAMDVSGSMNGRRYELAREAIENFTKAREGDAFGLTIFGSAQIRWIPLTKDLTAIRNAMPFANPADQPAHMGGTLIGAALKFCRENMIEEAPQGDRLIILVSDGSSSDLGAGQEYEIADLLKESHITLYHIHVAEDDIPQEVVEIARNTGGDAFEPHEAKSLDAVFKHIDKMKPALFKPVGTAPMDHFRPFAIAALCLIGLHTIGLMGLRYTPW